MEYSIGQELEIDGEKKIITDILPVLIGSKPIDYIYGLDDDMDQRYNTQELKDLL
jgi:hypothetical protein